MPRGKPFWQIYPPFLLITLGAIVAVSLYVRHVVYDFHEQRIRQELEARARLAGDCSERQLAAGRIDEVQQMARAMGEKANARFTIILPDGVVVGDSDEDPAVMDNHANRPEIRRALGGETGAVTRPSPTLKRRLMYVAVPIESEDEFLGVMRTALPVGGIENALRPVYAEILFVAVIVALLAAGASFVLSRRIAGPLEELQRGATRFAEGAFDRKLPLSGPPEVAALADAMNLMASRLDERIRTVLEQRNEMEAVLDSMKEGVMAFDQDQCVLSVNPAGARLLDVDPEKAVGRRVQEVVRNPQLQTFVARALASKGMVEDDITLPGQEQERFLQARAVPLLDADGENQGTLLVLNDVTRLRRLENVRREFVANVSHELRTPITAIKGFSETLLEQGQDADTRGRYLQIIARQSDRLQSLFDDLLTLSQTERQAERGEISLEQAPVWPVVESAVVACRRAAREKGIDVEADCPEEIEARINPALLEQAVYNLLENAVNYSPPESHVQVAVTGQDDEVSISVSDDGPGIARRHLPRLFERFYRADGGRDRKSGGTGLGLAIVKHIAHAHGGRVTVDSTPGRGSTFTIYLPVG